MDEKHALVGSITNLIKYASPSPQPHHRNPI